MTNSAILHMVGVSKAYGSAADPTSVLRDVNLTIERGQKTSLIGPSGSVDFPLPDGPMRLVFWPRSMVRLTSRRTKVGSTVEP